MRLVRPTILLAITILAAPLGGCGGGSNFSTDDAISTVGSALSLTTAALGVANSGYSRPTPTYSAPQAQRTYTPPATNGYSQRGAFEDCEKIYGRAGMEAQARTCRDRANKMGSLH